ncbi:MAG: hypothetical protein R3293_07730 [Candidatus Promineifilaceae bacterium]|nr:hypothetical protein [Candidatus Promineifilaceae bacterium]
MAIIAGGIWEQAAPDKAAVLFDSLVDIDLEQGRIDTALPIPSGDLILAQKFTPHHDGLQEIELTAARYGAADDAQEGQLTLQLVDDSDTLLAEQTWDNAALDHNQVIRFTFPRQNRSAGRPYELQLVGSQENKISVWGYSLDVYEDGSVFLINEPANKDTPTTPAQDLRFVTRYHLTARGALNALVESIFYESILIVLTLFFLPLPGCLLLLFFHLRWVATLQKSDAHAGDVWPWDPAAWWGTAFALGVAGWGVIWLWGSLLGMRWTPWLLWLVVIIGWLVVTWLWWQDRVKRRQRVHMASDMISLAPHPALTLSWRKVHLLLLLILLVALAVRLLAVRDVSFPLWVDSSRHGLITAVMVNSGQVIGDYAPFLPVDRFPYHFGFHTLAASLSLMSQWPLPRLLLYFGQLLNALVPFMMYTAVWLYIRRSGTALFAAFLVALPFFFPAYYATWGRFTQLTAVILLPVLLALSWRLVRGEYGWRRVWWMVGLLAAGLFLTHIRVFLYYLPYVLLIWLMSLGRNARRLAAAAGLALLLAGPRMIQLLNDTDPVQRIGRTIPNYNNFPTSYFETGWEQAFILAAAIGILFAFLAFIRRKEWALLPLTLTLWVALLFFILSADRIGLPVTSLVNLNSMYIIVFVPLAIFLALIVDPVWRWLRQQHWVLQLIVYLLVGVMIGALFIFGARQQIGILNSQTILARSEDLKALQWVEDNIPEDATLLVNSWQWLGETWAAADGGAWLVPLTGRQVTTPPIDHIYDAELFRFVREFNQDASAISDWSDPSQVDWLRQQGVTHVFVGRKGGFLDPAELVRNPKLELLYGDQGVFIFALKQ